VHRLKTLVIRSALLFSASLLLPISGSFSQSHSAGAQRFVVDRARLPQALQQIQLEHLSSGALMLLDHNGDLVRPPVPRASMKLTPEAAAVLAPAVALDPRVGANMRLGDDPSTLPAGMRAQAEPHIARSPINSDFLVAAFQEGRFVDGGAVDCGYAISGDGGLTWSRALIPNLTQTSGGSYFRATDPVAGVDLHGNIYLNTEGATDTNFNNGDIVVSRSSDGGQTFGAPSVVYHPPNNTVFPDKPWMAINTFAGTATVGRILATFTLFSNTNTVGGSIRRAYSDDGGATWSATASVNSGVNTAQGSQPLFLPNGNAVVVYWNFGTSSQPAERLEAVISTNGGTTFGNPKRIAFGTEYNEPSIRTGSFLPSAVGDRANGNLYVVYQTRLAGNPKIAFSKSIDGGNTWSVPIAISDNPSGSGVFNPAINVSADGQTLAAVFYDHRDNPGSNTLVDLYLAQSSDGGATWQPNIRITSVSSDASVAPLTSSGYMLGDYQGIAEATHAGIPAVPVWIDTRTGDPDPFVARVDISPTQTPTPTPTPTATPVPTATPSPTPVPSPRVSVNASTSTVNEGADAFFTISASTINPFQATTVHYTMSGKAQAGTDYTLSGIFGQADIAAGAASTTVTLHALTDAVREKTEKATLKLSPGPNYLLGQAKKATIAIVNVP
jgi:hypothetical protein